MARSDDDDGSINDTRMRVVLVTDNLNIGGVQRVVVDLATALSERSVDVLVVAAGGELVGEVPSSAEFLRVRGRTKLGRLVHTSLCLLKVSAARRPTVFHAHQRGVALIAYAVAQISRAAMVEHVHSVFPSKPVSRAFSFRSPDLIACGSEVERMLAEDFNRPTSSIHLIRNAVRSPRFATQTRAPLDARVRIAGVGRLGVEKDPVKFVEVLAALIRFDPDRRYEAFWAGDGVLAPEMQTSIEANNVDEALTLLGAVSNVPELLARSDLLLMTSKQEGLPLSAIEAMSVGTPVVVPDLGSCRDLFLWGKVGLLYEPTQKPEQLAVDVIRLLDETSYPAVSRQASTTFSEHFSYDSYVDEIIEVYRHARRRLLRAK